MCVVERFDDGWGGVESEKMNRGWMMNGGRLDDG